MREPRLWVAHPFQHEPFHLDFNGAFASISRLEPKFIFDGLISLGESFIYAGNPPTLRTG